MRPKGGDLCPYDQTQVVSEKGSGYSFPHWEACKGRASDGSGPQSDFKINEIELNWTGPKTQPGVSTRSGVCGPPYYRAPLVRVPAVIGVLAVWWHYKPTNQRTNPGQVAQTPLAGTGDSVGWFRRCLCSILFNYNLSLRGTFCERMLPLPDNCGLLPTPKETYDLNVSADTMRISSFRISTSIFCTKELYNPGPGLLPSPRSSSGSKGTLTQKRLQLGAGHSRFIRQMAYFETKFDEKYFFQEKVLGCFWCNFLKILLRSFACAFDRFDATVERIPVKFLRFYGLFHTQMGTKVVFAPGAVRILLCHNQTWEV